MENPFKMKDLAFKIDVEMSQKIGCTKNKVRLYVS